jgi:lipopolysaccharide/colanic/teichoic acid biosynthesis glycosyltransferase
MTLKSFSERLSLLTRPLRNRTLHGVYSPETFRLILERERVRADRYGGEFSLLVFDLGNPETDDDVAQRLAQVLAGRARTCDEVGWFDKHRIGAVLPGTSAEGARKLADYVCHAIDGSKSPPASTVHTYPSEWLREATANPSDHSCAKSESGEYTTSAAESNKIKTQDCSGSAQGIGLLLAPRMPAWKRTVDITGALLGFILVLPLFLIIGILIKIVSPGPVFFKQDRVGYTGKKFTIYKFRTMKVNSDSSAHQKHVAKLMKEDKPFMQIENDARIIPLGNILRNTFLDELPQLINVLTGEMSLVGPRPDLTYAVPDYELWQCARFNSVPGMTGLWQVSGKNKTTFKEMVRHDITYCLQKSFWLDVKILLLTVLTLIRQTKNGLLKKRIKTQ